MIATIGVSAETIPVRKVKNGFRLVAAKHRPNQGSGTDQSWLYRQSWLNNWPIGRLKSAKIDSKTSTKALFKVIGYIHDSNSLLIKLRFSPLPLYYMFP